MEERNAAIVCDEGRYGKLSRIATDAGFIPFKADVEKAATAAREGDCALIISDGPRPELESLASMCVYVGEDGRFSLPGKALMLSALGGLGPSVHAIAKKFSELAAEQEEIRRQQARISNFLTGLQEAQAPKELIAELLRLKAEAGGYPEILERVEEALMEARERIDELLRVAAEQEAGRAKKV